MSQTGNKTSLHKLVVRNRIPGTVSTGANTQILLDDQPLKGCTFLKLEFKPRNIVKATIELIVDVDVETELELADAGTRKEKSKIPAWILQRLAPVDPYDPQ